MNLIRLIPAKGGTKKKTIFLSLCFGRGFFFTQTFGLRKRLKIKSKKVKMRNRPLAEASLLGLLTMALLKINGIDKTYAAEAMPATLADLLTQMKIDEATVVVEIDGRIVPPEAFAQTPLADGMTLELVRFVPGG